MHIIPSFVPWTFQLCFWWFQGLVDLLPYNPETDTVSSFTIQAGSLHPGGMKYPQIATWVCIPLLTCHGAHATNSAHSDTGLQLDEDPGFSKIWQVLGPFEIGTRGMWFLSITKQQSLTWFIRIILGG